MIDKAIGLLARAEAALRGRQGRPAPGSSVAENFDSMPQVEVFVAESESPIARDEHANSARNETALALNDPDTYGYIVMVMKKPPSGTTGKLFISGYVQEEWWPAFIELCRRTSDAGLDLMKR